MRVHANVSCCLRHVKLAKVQLVWVGDSRNDREVKSRTGLSFTLSWLLSRRGMDADGRVGCEILFTEAIS